jgi:LuxR family maltose regulon positive regulatory protein
MSRVDFAQGQLDEALDRLERLQKMAEEDGGGAIAIESLVLQAVIHQATNRLDQALTILTDALERAEPENYIRIFVDEGAPMGQLLREAADQGIGIDYSSRLLAALADEPQPPSPTIESVPTPLIEPLSDRELEVLRLVAAGLSNQQVAQALFVSINTVKSHAKNIYGKLGVHSRTQAVNKARVLGLI